MIIELLVEFTLEQGPQIGPVSLCNYRQAEALAYGHAMNHKYYSKEPEYNCIYPQFPSVEECQKHALWYGGSFIQQIGGARAHELQFRFVCSSDAAS